MSDTTIHNSTRPFTADLIIWQEIVSGDSFANVPTPYGYVSVQLNHTAQLLHLQFVYAGMVHVRRYNEVGYSKAYAITLAQRFATESVVKSNMEGKS